MYQERRKLLCLCSRQRSVRSSCSRSECRRAQQPEGKRQLTGSSRRRESLIADKSPLRSRIQGLGPKTKVGAAALGLIQASDRRAGHQRTDGDASKTGSRSRSVPRGTFELPHPTRPPKCRSQISDPSLAVTMRKYAEPHGRLTFNTLPGTGRIERLHRMVSSIRD